MIKVLQKAIDGSNTVLVSVGDLVKNSYEKESIVSSLPGMTYVLADIRDDPWWGDIGFARGANIGITFLEELEADFDYRSFFKKWARAMKYRGAGRLFAQATLKPASGEGWPITYSLAADFLTGEIKLFDDVFHRGCPYPHIWSA